MSIGSLLVYAALIIGACRLGKEFVFVFGTFNIVASNALVGYEIEVFGFTTLWIVLLYCMNFLAINCLTEFYSKKDAVKYVLNMAVMQFLFFIFIASSGLLELKGGEEYRKAVDVVFAATPRVTVAAIISHMLLFIDAHIYKFFKDKEGQGWYGTLWFRATLSAVVTHFLVNAIFFCVAFYGVLPNEVLVSIIISNMLIKYALSFAETPLMYVARFVMRGKKPELMA
jgi:queuosine precursor transporter